MEMSSIKFERANIRKVNMRLMQNVKSGAQKVAIQVVGMDGRKTVWQEVNRNSIENRKLTGDILNCGLSADEKKCVIETAWKMFLVNDDSGNNIVLEGEQSSITDMYRDLFEVMEEMLKNAEESQMREDKGAIWIRTTYFGNVESRMKALNKYGRSEILKNLKCEGCLITSPSRSYDYQVSENKGKEHPRYYVIKKEELKRAMEAM